MAHGQAHLKEHIYRGSRDQQGLAVQQERLGFREPRVRKEKEVSKGFRAFRE